MRSLAASSPDPTAVSPEVSRTNTEDPTSPARRGFLKGSLSCCLLPAFSAPWLTSCGGGSTLAPTPRLASVDNFRDVAGANNQGVYCTSSGAKLRRGVLYRSNVLVPSTDDLATLDTLNLVADYDLRTPGEIKKQPDTPPADTAYLNINLVGTENLPAQQLTSVAEAISGMEASYVEFITDSGIRGRLAQLFQKLAATSGPQVYHCSGGKDRTGWVTTILLTIVGVPQSVIIQDYMLTNVDAAASIQASYQQMVTAYGQAFADIYYPTLIADQRYLNAALNQVATSYKTMANYIDEGLGLSSSVQTQLREKFLI